MSKSTQLLETQLEELLAEVVAYNNKPNKSISKRIRTKLGAIKKNTASIRAELISLDKAGY